MKVAPERLAAINRWREQNPEAVKAHRRKSNKKRLPTFMRHRSTIVASARKRAAKKGIPATLKAADLKWPEVCPVLGIRLDYSYGTKGKCAKDNSPSLDRLKPELGYVAGNVIVVSHRANCLRNNASPVELRCVADFYEKLNG